MAGRVDIANIALTDIGANTISGFPEEEDRTLPTFTLSFESLL